MVSVSHGQNVVICHQYQGRLDGKPFTSMERKPFPNVFKKTEHYEGRLFLQDGFPVQNSAAALKAMKKVKADIFSIPLRIPDLNPTENFFSLISKKLNDNALDNFRDL